MNLVFEKTWRKLFQEFIRIFVVTESIYQQSYICTTKELKVKKNSNVTLIYEEDFKNESFTRKLDSHFLLRWFQLHLGVAKGERGVILAVPWLIVR